jgi:hypothetical protein
VNTRTAERTFALKNAFDIFDNNISHLSLCDTFLLLRAAIHSAVRVFTGEADEIAAQSYSGFCGKFLTYKMLHIAVLLVLATNIAS